MNKFKKVLALLVIATLTVGTVTGCGSEDATAVSKSSAATEHASEGKNVRVSYWAYNIQGTLFQAAQEFGIWDEVIGKLGDDVNIELIPFENGPVANEAITAGELDIELSLGDQPFITGNANGVDTSILATTMKQEKSYITVVAADSDINSPADLKGKNIGVGIGTFSHKSFIGILDDNGIDVSEVSFTNLGDAAYGEALTAIGSGELDAYFGPWSSLAQALEEGTVKQIGDGTGHPLTTYFVAKNEFINDNPEITEALVETLYKTVDYINNNKEEAVAFFSKQLDWDEEIVSQLLDKVEVVVDLTDEDITSITETQKFLLDQEILDEEVEDLIEKHTNSTFINEVKK